MCEGDELTLRGQQVANGYASSWCHTPENCYDEISEIIQYNLWTICKKEDVIRR
jgi:hypothetical protein